MKTDNRTNAIQWLKLRDEVLASIGILNGLVSDKQTLQVMCSVTRVLMNKQALTPKLKDTFIECIRRRTRHTDFSYDGEIRLNSKQLAYARRTGAGSVPGCAPNSVPQSVEASPLKADELDLLEAFQRYFAHLSSTVRPDFNHLSSVLGEKAAETLAFWWRNEMKSKEIDHEPDMICASPSMMLAGSPDVHNMPVSTHEPAAPELVHIRAVHEISGDDVVVAGEADPVAEPPLEIAISFFQSDPFKAASANIEFCGEKYHLNFTTVDAAEDRLFQVCSRGWKEWYCDNGGDNLRAEARALGSEGSPKQYLMSPIYFTGDKFGRKAPLEDAVVIIDWAAVGVPETICVLLRQKFVSVPMTRFSQGEGNRPTFKGKIVVGVEGH